jgi:hypothetical protein
MTENKITLNASKERLKRIKVKVGQALGNDISYIFYIDANSKDNTYGILVSGDGKVDLQELRRQGIEEGNTASDYWTYNGEDVSPAYIYKKSDYQNLDELMVDIGVSTDKAIYSSGGLLSDIVAQYVNNNQTIPADGFFDVHRLSDGEILLLYSSTIGEIKITGESGTSFIRNSPTNGTEWVNSKSAVMMIGTNNDSLEWKTPFAPKDNLTPEITYQYPLMILNGVDFLASVYNRINETMTVFAKCYDESNRSFIGCLIFNLTTLLYKNFKCTDKNYNPSSPEQTSLSFLYRVPLLAVDFFTDSNKRWTSYNNILPTEWGYVPAIDKVPADSFVRIIGGTGTSSQISYDGDIGIISTHMLENGTIIMFYDIISGIKAAFSSDGGEHWFSPNIIYAREASSAFLMGWYLYYITTDGIRMKKTDPYDFYSGNEIAVKKAAGIDVSFEELNIQSKLDKEETLLIGSGVINSQRLSGYVSPSGIIKLFFYNDKGLLKSMESTNTFTWNVTDNF